MNGIYINYVNFIVIIIVSIVSICNSISVRRIMDNSNYQELSKRLDQLENKFDELSKKYLNLIDYVTGQKHAQSINSKDVVANTLPIQKDEQIEPNHLKQDGHLKNEDHSQKSFSFLPVVSAICFVFAGIFLIKMTMDSGWLTLERQWGLASFFGIILLVLGRYLDVVDKVYRSYLSASGVIVLYSASVASYSYFNILPLSLALSLAVVSSLICVFLANYHKSEIFLFLTAIGVNLLPIMLGKDWNVLFTSAYYLFSTILFSGMAVSFQNRTLSLLSSYLSVGIYAFLNRNVSDELELIAVIASLLMHFMIVSGHVTSYSLRHKTPLSENQSYGYLLLSIFFYAVIYHFLNLYTPFYVNLIVLSLCLVLLAFYHIAKKQLGGLRSQIIVYPFAMIVICHAGYFNLLPIEFKVWVLPLALFVAHLMKSKFSEFRKQHSVLSFLCLSFFVVEILRANFKLMLEQNTYDYIPLLLCVGISLFHYLKVKSEIDSDNSKLMLACIHLQAVLALYSAVVKINTLAVSGMWSIYALIILALGFVKSDKQLAKSSFIVFAITAIKALLYDLSSAATGVRIMSLILTGLVLYLAGYAFKKIDGWK